MRNALISLLLLLGATPAAFADWTVDNEQSRLSFVSVKAGTVAEVHRFETLSGWLGEDGRFRLAVDLASVDTLIPIRDERMREMLFETGTYPEATLTAQLDLAPLRELAVGDQVDLVAEAELDLRGQKSGHTVQAVVVRLAKDTLLVTSAQPLVLNASALGLADGIERLREIAGLPSISPAVPVTFRLTLRADATPAGALSQR